MAADPETARSEPDLTVTLAGRLLESLDHSYRSGLTTVEFLEALVRNVGDAVGSVVSALYIEDDASLVPPLGSWVSYSPSTQRLGVLAAVVSRAHLAALPGLLNPDALQLTPQAVVRGSVSCSLLSQSSVVLPQLPQHTWMILDSAKVALCRGLLFLLVPDRLVPAVTEVAGAMGFYLEQATPVLEAVHRRNVQAAWHRLVELGGGRFTCEPIEQFQQMFEEACGVLGVEGASLLIHSASEHEDKLQFVATWPKAFPPEPPPTYSTEIPSATTAAFKAGKDTIIRDVRTFLAAYRPGEPSRAVWSDIPDVTRERSLMSTLHPTKDGTTYILRCTNSTANPTRHFHLLDLERAKEFVALLSLLHRAIENEFRAVRLFLDISHELKQRFTGIVSAARYVKKSLVRNITSPNAPGERIHKLDHIVGTIGHMVTMLQRFHYPFPSTPAATSAPAPFRPYADLVRPVTELFLDKARSRGVRFRFRGGDQLGLVYASLDEWRQVVENLVNNAIKYTHRGEEIQVAFERVAGSGGGRIHFASHSLPIAPEERDRIFDFRFRTRAARAETDEGDGIGLAISRFIVTRYGGQILVRTEGEVNVFTVVIPRHLFRAPGSAPRERLRLT